MYHIRTGLRQSLALTRNTLFGTAQSVRRFQTHRRIFQSHGSTAGSLQSCSDADSLRRGLHSKYDPAYEEQSFTLSDGRTMRFAEYGARNNDPSTPVAFFFHGAPGSRYDGAEHDYIARKLSARVIAPDRPGHGLSTYQAGRKLLDYANEIRQLAKHLAIKKYHVFGQSGGGPFAIACAYAIPHGELLSTGVVAGMGPPELITIKIAGFHTVAALCVQRNIPNFAIRLNDWRFSAGSCADDKQIQKLLDQIDIVSSPKRIEK